MNREQRRLASRQRKIENKVREQVREGIKMAECTPKEIEVELYYTVFGLALEELYGFKTERIKKAWKRADEIMGDICDSKCTLEDMKQRLRDKASIECSFH